jgi:hypothetical protein
MDHEKQKTFTIWKQDYIIELKLKMLNIIGSYEGGKIILDKKHSHLSNDIFIPANFIQSMARICRLVNVLTGTFPLFIEPFQGSLTLRENKKRIAGTIC